MQFLIATIFFIGLSIISQKAADNYGRCYRNFEPDCYYDLKEKYRGVEEFEFFWVDEVDRTNFLFRGAVYVNKTFHKIEGTVKANRISFAVSLPRGIGYRFEGAFLPGGRRLYKDRIAIDGRLIKLNESKKLKVRNVKLIVRYGYNQ